MAVLKYKNPNYVVGGTEEKYLPLSNVIVGSSEIYIGETEPTDGYLIWINPIDNITKYKYNDTWVELVDQTQNAYGVFIEDTNGKLYTSEEWDGSKTPNSIVVKQLMASFRIALTESSSTMQISVNSTDPLEKYMTAISDIAQAKLDMKSEENTANIMKLQSGTGYAAGYCNSFTFPDGKTKGLLPALGWLQTAYDNRLEIDACLAACGAVAIDTNEYYWTSTFQGVNSINKRRDCWILNWHSGEVTILYGLSSNYRVRPFAEYN